MWRGSKLPYTNMIRSQDQTTLNRSTQILFLPKYYYTTLSYYTLLRLNNYDFLMTLSFFYQVSYIMFFDVHGDYFM